MSSLTANRPMRRGGGCLASGRIPVRPRTTGPLRNGPDVSWLSRVRAGDDQGQVGACVMFAFASWAEIVHGFRIPDAARIAAYRRKSAALGLEDDGLTIEWGFEQAKAEGWLPGATRIEPVYDLSAMVRQPILAAYQVTPAWSTWNAAGCLDHAADNTDLGRHAVVVVAHGMVSMVHQRLVYIENSWTLDWGWNGIGLMTEDLHRDLCRELWIVE